MKANNYPLLIVVFFFGLFQLSAQNTPRELENLVGMKAAYLDSELSNKGYHFIKNEKSGSNSYSNYWNNNRRKCITTRTNNGRVASIVDSPPFDCGKSGNDYSHRDYGYNDNHSNDNEKESYRRGYHDGHRRSRNNPYPHAIYPTEPFGPDDRACQWLQAAAGGKSPEAGPRTGPHTPGLSGHGLHGRPL